jgi:hypothetical protein
MMRVGPQRDDSREKRVGSTERKEQGAESREQRVDSTMQGASGKEQRAEGREQRAAHIIADRHLLIGAFVHTQENLAKGPTPCVSSRDFEISEC